MTLSFRIFSSYQTLWLENKLFAMRFLAHECCDFVQLVYAHGQGALGVIFMRL
jgi:hypothetical protein